MRLEQVLRLYRYIERTDDGASGSIDSGRIEFAAKMKEAGPSVFPVLIELMDCDRVERGRVIYAIDAIDDKYGTNLMGELLLADRMSQATREVAVFCVANGTRGPAMVEWLEKVASDKRRLLDHRRAFRAKREILECLVPVSSGQTEVGA